MIVYFDKKMDQLIKNDLHVTPIIFSKKGSGMLRGFQLNENVTAGDFGNIAREKGLLLVGAAENTIRLLPPLNTSKEEVDNAFDILDDIVLELKKT
jgi:acetylornithine/succinyldiaminopimelate/putrescine aminotransferase